MRSELSITMTITRLIMDSITKISTDSLAAMEKVKFHARDL